MPSSTANPEVIVAGHICLDVIPAFGAGAERLDEILVPGKLVEVGAPVVATGGAVSNTGLALHRLGIATRLVGKVGADLFGQAVRDVLCGYSPALAEGLVVTEGEPTSYTLVLSPPGVDRVFLHCPGANDTFHPDEVALDRLGGARIFHFGYPPLMRQTYADGGAALARLFEEVRARGLLVSLDMARPDPSAASGRVDWTTWLRRVLPHVDFFGPSLDEVRFMLDPAQHDPATAEAGGALLERLSARLLEMGPAAVLLKLGAEGLYLRTTDRPERAAPLAALQGGPAEAWTGRELLHPCFRVDEAGTTGSGDTTLAGFLAALLHGLPPEEALRAAVAVGACSVEQADATSGVPPWADVQARLRSGWTLRPTRLVLPGWRGEQGLRRGPGDRGQWTEDSRQRTEGRP